jgi:inner membrane protein
MPTIMSHALVPLSIGIALGRGRIAVPIIAVGMVLAMAPDADVIGFKLGVAYADALGHRGASHSFVAAAFVAALATWIFKPARPALIFAFLFIAGASHGLLDTLTNGGLGAALLWPFSETRYHSPVTPIRVSPIGIKNFISERGLSVLMSEARWIWLPCTVAALTAFGLRAANRPKKFNGNIQNEGSTL